METAKKTANETAKGNFLREVLENTNSIGITGARQSGKTAFAFYLSQFTRLPIYIFKYPKPELLPRNFNIIYDFEEMVKITDSFVWIDEPQLFIPIYEKKSNFEFMKLLSLMAQKGNILVASTSDTRFFTRGLESYIDTWIVKNIDYDTVKQGSKISKIIKKNTMISPQGFKLEKNEYIFENNNFKRFCGRHTFSLPGFWKDEMRYAFRDAW